MILPLGSGVYIIKSFRDGKNLELTSENRCSFTKDLETKAFQWKIEYDGKYYYFVNM